MFNTTRAISSVNTNFSYNVTGGPIPANSQTLKMDPAHHLGYGVGKIVRGSFDHLYNAWQKMWAGEPSSEELTMRRQVMIYSQGLRECALQLDSALDTLRKNPHDPSSLKRVQSLATDYALYLKPEKREEFRAIQQKTLLPLKEKISKLAHPHIRNALRQLLPIVFQESNPVKPSSEKDTRSPKQGALSAKPKRALQQASGWPASFDLTTLDGANGFKVEGLVALDYLGGSVSTAGDLNGDGKADLVLGAHSNAGTAYVLFGQTSGWPPSFDLTTLNGTNGFKVEGLSSSDQLDISVSTAGDVNGDGMADLVLGAPYASPGGRIYAGTAYVLFGQTSGWLPSFDLTTLNGTNGFKVEGLVVGDQLSTSVSTAGDLNGDGRDDLLLGASGADTGGGRIDAGTAYVLFGQTSGWPPAFDLTTLNGTNGFKVEGLAVVDKLGCSVSTAGDLNGDGKADLVLGANTASPGGRTYAGTAYVLFGQTSGWTPSFNLTTLNGTNGFKVDGLGWGEQLGFSVNTAGDLNGDGITDLVLGAPGADPGGRGNAGTAYVLFGQASGWPGALNLATLNGTNGFKVDGLGAGEQLGFSVSTAGDLNGDGKADLVLGAYHASSGVRFYAGTAYVLFGQTSGWPPSFDLTTLNGTNGFKVEGLAADDNLGYSVSTAGDLNGDGFFDLLLGAPTSPNGTAYIILGGNRTLATPFTPSFIPSTATMPSAQIPSASSPIPSTSAIISPSQTATSSPGSTASVSPTSNSSLIVPSPISGSTARVSPTSNNNLIDVPTPTAGNLTIGIAAGIGGAVLLGAVAGIVGLLWRKKKACFAERSEYQTWQNNGDVEQGLENSSLTLAHSLFIPRKVLEIGDKIAEGNFGDVYRGTYQAQRVAIKQLKGSLSTKAEEKLFEEVKIMGQLRSPYVVAFYGVTKDQPYMIVMQYMEGGSLRDFLKGHTPEKTPWDLRLQISQDIGQGLKYLYGQKIVHADLTSLNILLNEKKHALLADFGLASVKTDNMEQYYQKTTETKGSLLWMAPELFEDGRHTFATDMYSFGVVLWEIATHHLPFQASNWEVPVLIAQISKGTREKFPENVPDPYQALAKRCWDGDPTARPDAEEAAGILSALWKKEGDGVDDNEMEMVAVSSQLTKGAPSYLTGTVASPNDGKSSYDQAQTKFGI